MAETDPNQAASPPGSPGAGGAAPDPAAMADGALKAAQDAVNQIKTDASAAPVSAPDSATADALAAVQAALNEVNNPTAGGLGGGAVSDDGAADAPASFALPGFSDTPLNDKPGNIDLLADVNLNVKIELGRTRMFVEDVLRLGEGSVVELDKLAGDPVDIYVNERHVARGEVLVLNDNFCIRVNEIISPLAQEEAA
jgi:flagellar motor switch protein FliN/FliY